MNLRIRLDTQTEPTGKKLKLQFAVTVSELGAISGERNKKEHNKGLFSCCMALLQLTLGYLINKGHFLNYKATANKACPSHVLLMWYK